VDGLEKKSGRVRSTTVSVSLDSGGVWLAVAGTSRPRTPITGKNSFPGTRKVEQRWAATTAPLRYVRFLSIFLHRHVVDRRGSLQLIPSELAAFNSALQRLEQHN
jgi:hypothetical protein